MIVNIWEVMAATIIIVLGLGLLYWVSDIVIKKTGRLKGKNEQSLTHGKNLIFKIMFFGLYLIFVTCLGLFDAKETGNNILKTEWYQLILFIIPSIIFWLWLLTEYVFIIFLKCKIGEKELEKQILLDIKREEVKENKKEEKIEAKVEAKAAKKSDKNTETKLKKDPVKKTKN